MSEQDVSSGDGSPPTGGGVTLHVGHGESAPKEDDLRGRYASQLLSIAFASLIVMGVVWLSFEFGYEKKDGIGEPPIPRQFWIPIGSAIFVGFVAPLWVELRDGIAKGLLETEPSATPLPKRLLATLVYLLTGGVVFALVSLVSLTGGFVDSPFTPVMTAPAALGTFMAREKKTIAQLTAVGLGSVWTSICLIDGSSPELKAEPWVVGLMASSMMLIAGGLSYLRHRQDEKKR